MKVILAPEELKAQELVAPVIRLRFFSLLHRGGKVYTEIVLDCSAALLQRVIRGKVDVGSVIHSDGWRGYTLASLGQTLMD